ncbi:adenosylcobinamide-GDP ribazoletransferase [Halocalculus aciditolerans]|uniref:Adenosylcobinamide-GDP ribazoletransferase n=1 Tax=Halocalculus aciditolerans TaxID=1383812 RepID=A0A830FNS5_9EURY|nr:adenosylcobinamide-GDP ribazoletransferase [Halocalculus aciditolerans]GGL65688.1 adenosylcobinamide-GDP ribazoletransferase [Halocalculus aciditolerans]
MVLTALRGALGFLTRLPVGRTPRAWEAFCATPAAFPLAGYPVGVALALPVLIGSFLGLEADLTAFAFLLAVYAVTGVAHADAVADLGDAAAVHGDVDRRREVLKDSAVGVGAVLALGLVLLGTWTAVARLAALPVRAVGLVVAAEVGAKLAMATVACLGDATHDGLGAAVSDAHDARSLLLPVLVALPAALATYPNPAAAVALAAAGLAALCVLAWASRRLGGSNGDVVGASNELARLAALLTGVIAWTLW